MLSKQNEAVWYPLSDLHRVSDSRMRSQIPRPDQTLELVWWQWHVFHAKLAVREKLTLGAMNLACLEMRFCRRVNFVSIVSSAVLLLSDSYCAVSLVWQTYIEMSTKLNELATRLHNTKNSVLIKTFPWPFSALPIEKQAIKTKRRQEENHHQRKAVQMMTDVTMQQHGTVTSQTCSCLQLLTFSAFNKKRKDL